MKICTKCGLEKPIEEFSKNRTKKDGLSCECKKCHQSRYKQYYNKNKERYRESSKRKREKLYTYLNQIKKNGCSMCGEKDIACLDFHHIRDKSKNISELVSIENFNRLVLEVDKCIVLCANCHRKLHYHKH